MVMTARRDELYDWGEAQNRHTREDLLEGLSQTVFALRCWFFFTIHCTFVDGFMRRHTDFITTAVFCCCFFRIGVGRAGVVCNLGRVSKMGVTS